ncbi:hypothetical protein [Streptomyces rubiginosohelvolus]
MTGSEPQISEDSRQSWCYSAGEWITFPDPLPAVESRSFHDMVKAAGFETWMMAGEVYKVPLTLAVYTRAPEPCFLFDLKGSVTSQQFYARSLPDALVLLNQLVPTVQAAAVTDQIAQADSESGAVLTDLLGILRGRGRGA